MKHISVPASEACELLDFTSISPLISHCNIKICYVGDEPNRNGSIITKEFARDHLGPSLRGVPLVGKWDDNTEDFEEHNREIKISSNKFEIIDTTRPWGFVDLNAKVWFQKFLDDGVEHEYLMTEGYVWDKIYPEAERIIEKGNNQSMELYEPTLKGEWTKTDKKGLEAFIINEAVIQKLCILGEDYEPCFEGAGIAANFSLTENFKNSMFSMVNELRLALQEGGISQMEEEKKIEDTVVVTDEDTEFKKKDEEEKKSETEDKKDSENNDDSDNEKKDESESESKSEEDEDEKKKKYSLDEIPEYVELQANFSALEEQFKNVSEQLAALQQEIEPLREFKLAAEKKEKQSMIDSFYMLSDADKKNVIDNIDTYSLKDIEAELSILCVRNKVNFNLEDDTKNTENNPVIYSLDDNDDNDSAPAWIRAVKDTQKNRNM